MFSTEIDKETRDYYFAMMGDLPAWAAHSLLARVFGHVEYDSKEGVWFMEQIERVADYAL